MRTVLENQKSPIQTSVRNFYQNITQFDIAQNQALLSLGCTEKDHETYWYWKSIQEIGGNN